MSSCFNFCSFKYGSVSVNLLTDRFNDCNGTLFIPAHTTEVTDVKVASYSADHWTDSLILNNTKYPGRKSMYNLSAFGADYQDLGDPYIVQIPPGDIVIGENNTLEVGTGDSPIEYTGCSGDNRAIISLRFKPDTLAYGSPFEKSRGSGNLVIWHDLDHDGTADENITLDIGDPTDPFDPKKDAMDDAIVRLLNSLNFVGDTQAEAVPLNDTDGDGSKENPIDIPIAAELKWDLVHSAGVRSMWGPVQVKLIVWQ